MLIRHVRHLQGSVNAVEPDQTLSDGGSATGEASVEVAAENACS